MIGEDSKDFQEAQAAVLDKLSETYEALSDLTYYCDNPELEDMGDAILNMRSTIRLISENEQE